MPLRNIICRKREEVVTFDECIECSHDNQKYSCPFFPEFGQYAKDKAVEDMGRGLSVTRLLGCPRKAYLNEVIDYDVSLEDIWYLWRGTMVHTVLESFKDPEAIIETRFQWEVNGVEISFKPDKIDPVRGIVYDYKTVTTVADDFSLKWGNPRLKDQIQLNLYLQGLLKNFADLSKLCLVYIGSDSVVKHWVKVRTPDDKKLWKPMQEALDKAQLLSRIWRLPLVDVVRSGQLPMPDVGWECRYCNFERECTRLGRPTSREKKS